MKRHNLAAAAAIVALALASCSSEPQNPVLDITGGKVQGVLTDSTNVMVYKGIPFAAPPVGDLRWQAPQPVVAWDGVKVADTFAKIPIQPGHEKGSFYWNEFNWWDAPEQSEDCLYLNVWAPAGTVGNTGANLPVAMWVHGGGFTNGYSYELTMDGDAWAKRGVILVTITYRMGIIGFLSHPELSAEQGGVSGNYGFLDQVAALRWVKDNIAQFGGNPDDITIFGQSAGASSIKNLVMSPLSKDLMAKAIIQSGGGIAKENPNAPAPADPKMYDELGKAMMDAGGLTSLEKMRAASPAELNAASAAYVAAGNRSVRMAPHTDGKVLLESFDQAVYGKRIADIPYMIGYTAQDMGGLGGGAIDRFAAVRDSLSSQPTYQYFFQRNPPGDDDDPATDPGAFHSSELWYMFGTLSNCWRPFTEADYALSEKMVDAWTDFAKKANPGWKESGMNHYHETLDIE